MPPAAVALALSAAFLHALWNLLLARARDTAEATATAMLIGAAVLTPVAIAVWRVPARAAPYAAASAMLELIYLVLLAWAYATVDLSVVYPVARGLAPLLVLAVSVLALGPGTSPAEVAGVAAVAAGVVLVRGARRPAAGLARAVAIACCIAGYTLVDKAGVRHANPLAYLELVLAPPALAYAAAIARRSGAGALRRQLSPSTAAAGIASMAAYGLVLEALRLAPAAPVAAVRESSVLIATLAAARVLRERVSPGRVAGAAMVVGGIALLAA